jgi:hypothetical protein
MKPWNKVSDAEKTKVWMDSGYYKKFGKKSGKRLARRAAKRDLDTPEDGKVCRETKHLPW